MSDHDGSTENLAAWYQDRPRPRHDHVSATFWEGLADGELRYQGCEQCDHIQFYPRAICTGCGGPPEWRIAPGWATVHTYTVIRANGVPPLRQQVPYVVAILDVEPGFQLMGNVVGVDPDTVHIGMAVEAEFVTVDDEHAVVAWRPAT